jgi:hypothetical protein
MARPTAKEIVMAYIRVGYEAWQKKEAWAPSSEVEENLGLSVREGFDQRRYLTDAGLIEQSRELHVMNPDFRLLPAGIAFVEILDSQTAAVNAAAAPESEKASVIIKLRDKALETLVTKGVEQATRRIPDIIDWLQPSFP